MQALTPPSPRPLLLLDLDDTLCLKEKYDGMDVHRAMHQPADAPEDLYARVFATEAVETLNLLLEEFRPEVVLTTSWLNLLQRHHFVELFRRAGLPHAADGLHRHWDAPADHGVSRVGAIDEWLARHHEGQPILILDDVNSGESLLDSFHADTGRAVLCDGVRGFHRGHLDTARSALRRPYSHAEPWR